jgi:hypothetical protein
MANEILVQPNFCAGTITNAPLAAGGVTLNSAALANIPAIGATQFCKITLNPLGDALYGAGPEIVYVTSHVAAATDATIVRGRENTAAIQHAVGTPWVAGPTAADYLQVLTAAPAGGGMPRDGQMWYHHTEKRLYLSEAGSAIRMGYTTSIGRTGYVGQRQTVLAIATGGDGTQIVLTIESLDSDGFLAVPSGLFTIPAGLGGHYAWQVTFTWASAPASPGLLIDKNGSRIYATSLGYSSVLTSGDSGVLTGLAAGDTISFKALHQTGAAININPVFLDLYRIGN